MNSLASLPEGGGGSSWEDKDEKGGEGVTAVLREDGPQGCIRSLPEGGRGPEDHFTCKHYDQCKVTNKSTQFKNPVLVRRNWMVYPPHS